MNELSRNEGAGIKTDYTPIFDDFPKCFNKCIWLASIGSYQGLLDYLMTKHVVTFDDILEVRLEGCEKYSRNNWKLSKGTKEHDKFLLENQQSIYRHLVAWLGGEERDKDSKRNVKHLACVCLRCMFAIEYAS